MFICNVFLSFIIKCVINGIHRTFYYKWFLYPSFFNLYISHQMFAKPKNVYWVVHIRASLRSVHLYPCVHTVSPACSDSELWPLVLRAMDVDEVEAGCCAGGCVLLSWSSDSMNSSSACVGLVTDAADVDDTTAVAADAVVG